jgi:hypothetical protein
MATRAIITHQPEVSCDMCGRRLLRGERPDTFIAAGSRRTVCELCIPRAAGVGWMRESEALAAASGRSARRQRGRSLLDRLRQRRGLEDSEHEPLQEEQQWVPRRPADRRQDTPAGGFGQHEGWARQHGQQPVGSQEDLAGEPLYDDAEGMEREEWIDRADAGPIAPAASAPAVLARDPALPGLDLTLEQAIEIFNASECAGRLAGIARALGQPSVTVRASELDAERAMVVVAWELCWYRYEVDLRVRPATIALLAEGMELEELADEDRIGNAAANERGELSLL